MDSRSYVEMDDREVLEALYGARMSLERQTYKYEDWTTCGCGHIYVGATGRHARTSEAVTEPTNTRYWQVITRVATVLGWDGGGPGPVGYVSNQVADHGKIRSAARRVVQEAIDEIEAMQRDAMLKIADPAHEAPLA